eukprot:TRINITY_DN3496_c0_g1_i1.p1 TRINITY_DN3496_c0_g1~~TRINITY_DN3496_c0_g1_i1.p1  ORF type:complete len:1078 (-),score=280.91 TRINITY_DN3496_c0_g1_i1:34-3267(-)
MESEDESSEEYISPSEIRSVEKISLLGSIRRTSSKTFEPVVQKARLRLEPSFYGKFFLLNLRDLRNNKGSFCLGFLSCLLVVVVVTLLMTTIQKAPIVFLKLAEAEMGEIDFQLYAQPGSDRLNSTLVDEIISNRGLDHFKYRSPRYEKRIIVYSAKECLDKSLDPWDPIWKYTGTEFNSSCIYDEDNCFPTECPEANDYTASFYVIDTEKEAKMQLGREYIEKKISAPPTGHVHVLKSFASTMKISEGDILYLKINGSLFFQNLWESTINATTAAIESKYENSLQAEMLGIVREWIYVPVTVNKTIDGPQGKFAMDDSHSIIVEYSTLLEHVTRHLHPLLPLAAQQTLAEKDLYQYAESILWNLPPPRVEAYLDTDTDAIQKELVAFASQLSFDVGFGQVTPYLLVLSSLQQTNYFSMFLGMILNVVIFILMLLSVMLIYSLLTVSVDKRSFEMGVLRSMGISTPRLVYILSLQAFTYSLPSWVVGLAISQGVATALMKAFGKVTYINFSSGLGGDAVGVATLLVVSIPVFSSFAPIRAVINNNIIQALDRQRSKATSVKITIDRSEDKNAFSVPIFLTGLTFALFGFSIYYVFPLSLLSQNLSLLVYILVALLIGLLCGMVILTLNVAAILQNVMIHLFFFWDKSMIRQILQKNLIAHTMRNRRTTTMYALSLGFIIFLQVSYTLQVKSFLYQQEHSAGSFLKVYSKSSADISPLREDFEAMATNDSRIVNFAWVTRKLTDVTPGVDNYFLTNLGHFQSREAAVYAVSPNFFDTTFKDYLKINEDFEWEDTTGSILEELYTVRGSESALLSTYFADYVDLIDHPESHFLLVPEGEKAGGAHRMKTLAVLDEAPYIKVSKFPSDVQAVVVSFTTFLRLSNGTFNSVEELPLSNIFLKMKEGLSNGDYDDIKDKLNSIISANQNKDAAVWDYRQATQRAYLGVQIMFYFFTFAIAVAMTICYFSLMSSMYTNIHEQTKEIGVLRVLGTTKGWIYRIYIYEAFILVFSSSLLGTAIGTVAGWTMSIQRALWTQMPIAFVFPWQLTLVIFALSIIFSFLTSFRPIRVLMKLEVVRLVSR